MSKRRSELRFRLNGKQIIVSDPNPSTNLADFLRDEMHLRGLQLPCRQGGCGACTVVMSIPSASNSREIQHKPINSCLRPLCSMDGSSITTIEGIGSWKNGLHPLQEAIVKNNGTQCGFCTPGMVMTMYGLLLQNPSPDRNDVEGQCDGNICRCTGYRPILDAFQSFACNKNGASCYNGKSLVDIEDIGRSPLCGVEDEIEISKDGVTWIKTLSIPSLLGILKANRNQNVQLICGNTSSGIYPQQLGNVVVDISRIPELSKVVVDSNGVRLGGSSTLTDLVTVLQSNENLRTSYGPLLKHLNRVAGHQVRNVGAVAGNLMMTHRHPDFVSDVATILSAAGAEMTIYNSRSGTLYKNMSLQEFFKLNSVEGMVVLEILLPVLSENMKLFTFKVALRRVNSHPILNAGFKFEVDPSKGTIKTCPVIVYGGVKAYPVRAAETENFLTGKCYTDIEVFETALSVLLHELTPMIDESFGQSAYRTSLLPVFFYKAILSLWDKDRVPKKLQSSIAEYPWPITSGTVSFDKGLPSEYPVSQPVPKMSAAIQATGEVQYLDDFTFGDELHATYVLSTVANGKIKSIDPSKALAEKGVVSFISAETLSKGGYSNDISDYEQVFASAKVSYCGQALGLLVAKSKTIADAAAKLVSVEYTDVQKPIITIEDAIAANSFFEDRGLDFQLGSVKETFADSEVAVIEGQVGIAHQYHFHLETQRAVCVPSENGFLEVFSSTQNPSSVQQFIGTALNRPQHKITVNVKKVGGAYGAKINRSLSVAVACACAADILKRPVKLILDLSTNMQLIGGRSPYLCKYKISAKRSGEITGLQMDIFNNQGAHHDFEYPSGEGLLAFIDSAYNIPNWDLKMKIAKTNLPACTYIRGPVFVEATYMIEAAIEHLASAMNLPADQVRAINLYEKGDTTIAKQYLSHCNAKQVFDNVKNSSNYEERYKQVLEFNANSLWVKRGMAMIPVKFVASWESQTQLALVNIYPDGSISIHQSGCELGQGLDVKVAQVAAMALGTLVDGAIPLDNIAVHTTTTIVANNAVSTGGSVTSEICAKAVYEACSLLVERLKPVKNLLAGTENAIKLWKDLTEAAVNAGVDLQARARVHPGPSKDGPFQYVSFGAAATEVEVDLLTGETSIRRADVLLDCGKSLNPAVDVGQVQGAFVQGLGYYFTEEYRFDRVAGKLLTDGTWGYKPPSLREIPWEFNVSLLANSDNPSGFLRSKFSGEPPYAMSCSAILAVAQAIAAGKAQLGINDGFSAVNAPATVERVAMSLESPLSLVSLREMVLKL